ncbi:transposable element Tcb2 transposase [Trichonephila clavipes]|nr:transposable element Tcb2 transposase [Trichonephila clavipes]
MHLFGGIAFWMGLDCNGMEPVVFSDESRFNLSSDDNRVHLWRPRGERLNSAFALQRYTAPTAGVMVWSDIVFDVRSPLIF